MKNLVKNIGILLIIHSCNDHFPYFNSVEGLPIYKKERLVLPSSPPKLLYEELHAFGYPLKCYPNSPPSLPLDWVVVQLMLSEFNYVYDDYISNVKTSEKVLNPPPLIVLNGVPLSGIESLNKLRFSEGQHTIECLQATDEGVVLYGTRGERGVMIISTQPIMEEAKAFYNREGCIIDDKKTTAIFKNCGGYIERLSNLRAGNLSYLLLFQISFNF